MAESTCFSSLSTANAVPKKLPLSLDFRSSVGSATLEPTTTASFWCSYTLAQTEEGMKNNSAAAARRDEALREANRIHCRQSRQRKRTQERLLREEVKHLQLCRSIVESGPDLFSVHGLNPNAPFCFVSESFCRKLQIEPENILGQPLSSIVDPRDAVALRTAVLQVLGGGGGGESEAPVFATSGRGAGGSGSSSSWSSLVPTALCGPDPDESYEAVHQQEPAPAAADSSATNKSGTAAAAILNQESATAATPGSSAHSNGGDGGGGRGHLVNVRLARFGLSCYASMSIAVGSEGLIVVTRLYLP